MDDRDAYDPQVIVAGPGVHHVGRLGVGPHDSANDVRQRIDSVPPGVGGHERLQRPQSGGRQDAFVASQQIRGHVGVLPLRHRPQHRCGVQESVLARTLERCDEGRSGPASLRRWHAEELEAVLHVGPHP